MSITIDVTETTVEISQTGSQGPAGADSGISYQSVGALQALPSAPAAGTRVDTRGYASNGDGGAGVWYWDAASTATHDAGTVVKITAVATGRFHRIFNGPVHPEWFGAAGDGTTNDYAALIAAYTASPDGHIHLTGRYALNTQPVFTTPIRITGTTPAFISLGAADPDSTAKAGFVMAAGVSGPKFTATSQYSSMEHIEIESLSAGSAGSDIGVTIEGRRFRATHCSVDGFGSDGWYAHGVGLPTSSANLTVLDQCRASGNGGDGFHTTGGDATLVTIINGDAMLNAGHGYNIDGDHNHLINCHCNANTDDDWLVTGQSVVIDHPYSESGASSSLVINGANCIVRLSAYGRPTSITGDATGSASWFVTESTLRNSQHNGVEYHGAWKRWSVFNPNGPDSGFQYDWEIGASGTDQLSLRRRDTSTNPDTRQYLWRDRSDLARVTAEFYGDIASNVTNTQDLGRSSLYWRDLYLAGQVNLGTATRTISYGTGSPEGVVTATVGSVFLRTDGASGTTMYLKASGSGNTGWETAGTGAAAKRLNEWIYLVTGNVAVAANVKKPGYHVPVATTLTEVTLLTQTAPTGTTMIVDIVRSGSAIATITLPIATKRVTSTVSVALSVHDVLTFDVTQVGSGTAGADLAIQLIGS